MTTKMSTWFGNVSVMLLVTNTQNFLHTKNTMTQMSTAALLYHEHGHLVIDRPSSRGDNPFRGIISIDEIRDTILIT